MIVRSALCAAVTSAVIITGTPARAQTPPPPSPLTSDQLLSGGCGVGIRAVRALREPGRYLVEMLVPVATPPLPAVLRVDDRNGHWLYPPTTAPRFVIAVPESASGPLNVFAAFAHPATGQDVACRPTVYAPRPASDDTPGAAPGEPLAPSSTAPDAPASCAVPFEQGGRFLQPPRLQLPPEARGVEGVFISALLVSPDGSIAGVRVLSSPSPLISDAMARALQRVQVSAAVFRCAPVESQMFMTLEVKRAPPG